MTQYAAFNSSIPSPSPITGWYDTEFATYPNLPPASDLLEVTPAQWAARLENPSGWAVSNGALVAYTAPVPSPTLAQQAAAALSAGLAITSTGTPALDATYPCDANAQAQISAEVISLMLNGTFADGTTSIDWVDINRTGRTMTVVQFKAVATAIGAYVSGLTKCINGQATALPSDSATIP